MAKFLSQIWTSVSGSIGGITFFNGRHGHMVARSRTIPTNPQSTPQTQIRTAWSNAQGLWVNATPAQRDKWDDYAATVIYQGPAGSYTIGGRERMLATISLASYLNTVFGETIPLTASAPRDIGWMLLSNLETHDPLIPSIGFDLILGNPNDHDMVVHIKISQALPQTINSWKGPWDTPRATVASVPALSSATVSFTDLEDEKVYFLEVRAISDTVEHRISEAFILRAIAVDTNP